MTKIFNNTFKEAYNSAQMTVNEYTELISNNLLKRSYLVAQNSTSVD